MYFSDRASFENFCRTSLKTTGKLFGLYDIELDPKDFEVSYWLANDGFWESFLSVPIIQYFNLKNPKICVDVGAYVGYYSLLFLALGAEVVYAFEPNPASYSLLTETARKNSLCSRLVPINAAVSDFVGKAFLNDTKSRPGAFLSDSGILVEVTSLNEFFPFRPYPDFIKIDAEGSEESILHGMNHILTSGEPLAVVVEMASGRGYDVIDLFNRYRAFFSHWEELLHGIKHEDAIKNFNFFNFFFWR